MLNGVIIEDKEPAINELISTLSTVASDVTIISRLGGVSESVQYISQKPPIDIIFSSVRLRDGLSFEIFHLTNTCIPVIFFSDDNEYISDAFDCNCIAYLLKPVDHGSLLKALTKYRMLNNYFANGHTVSHHDHESIKHARQRMIVKKDKETISLPIHDIVLFHTGHRLVFVIDRQGNEYIVPDKNLCNIETDVDKEQFFRVNRQYIVNLNFIHGFKTHERVKLLVELTVPEIKHTVIVSQEMAPQFREWMYNA